MSHSYGQRASVLTNQEEEDAEECIPAHHPPRPGTSESRVQGPAAAEQPKQAPAERYKGGAYSYVVPDRVSLRPVPTSRASEAASDRSEVQSALRPAPAKALRPAPAKSLRFEEVAGLKRLPQDEPPVAAQAPRTAASRSHDRCAGPLGACCTPF